MQQEVRRGRFRADVEPELLARKRQRPEAGRDDVLERQDLGPSGVLLRCANGLERLLGFVQVILQAKDLRLKAFVLNSSLFFEHR